MNLASSTSITALAAVLLFACGDDASGTGGGDAATGSGSTSSHSTSASQSGSTTGGGQSQGGEGEGGDGQGGDAEGGGGGKPGPVACAEAEDGDPCASPGETCGATECFGCSKLCDGSTMTWSVTCSEAPECEPDAVRWGGVCDDFCGPFECGPYDVETTCGTESITAECGPFGWVYPTECAPDCRNAIGPEACGAMLDCIWIQPCEGSDRLDPRCVSLAAPLGRGGIANELCSADLCPEGTVCVEYGINPGQPASGDCSNAATAAATCEGNGVDSTP
jgi:hypothetical protein